MRARDLVGRKIVKVVQQFGHEYGRKYSHIDYIVLDNGRALYFVVRELEGDYAVEGHLTQRPSK